MTCQVHADEVVAAVTGDADDGGVTLGGREAERHPVTDGAGQ